MPYGEFSVNFLQKTVLIDAVIKRPWHRSYTLPFFSNVNRVRRKHLTRRDVQTSDANFPQGLSYLSLLILTLTARVLILILPLPDDGHGSLTHLPAS